MFDRPQILGSASLVPSRGPPASIGEVFSIDFATQRDQNLSISDTMAREEKYNDLVNQTEERFGRRLITPDTGLTIGRSGTIDEAQERFFEELQEIWGDTPLPIQSAAELNDLISQERQAQRERQSDIGARATTAGSVAGFAGSSLALLADPPIAISTLFGASASAGILRTALTEAGIATAVEIPVQFDVQLGRRAFGEDPSFAEATQNVAFAGAGGFLFGAAFKGAGVGSSKIRELLNKSKEIENPSEAVKDAQVALERFADTDEANPLQRTAQGQEEHLARLDEAHAAARQGRVADLGNTKTPVNSAILRSQRPVRRDADPLTQVFEAFASDARNRATINARQGATREVLTFLNQSPEDAQRVFSLLKDAPEPVESLLGFLGRTGVDEEQAGLLRRVGVTEENAPGVIRAGGDTFNRAIGRAREQGFFPGRARVNRQEFLDAIEAELRGDKIVRAEDEHRLIEREVLNDFRQGLEDFGLDIEDMTFDQFEQALQANVPQRVRETVAERQAGNAAAVDAARVQDDIDNIDRTDGYTENNFETTFEGADELEVTVTRADGTEEVVTIGELRRRLNQDTQDLDSLRICAGVQ